MFEQSKASRRRAEEDVFQHTYYVGHGLDVGAGNDPLSKWLPQFPKMLSVRSWDMPDGDAQYLDGVADNSFDFVSSSHCLEHMRDVHRALNNWLRVLKPGGYLVVTVPDEDMYEQGVWPSNKNPDHKSTFTTFKEKSWSPVSINVYGLSESFDVVVKRIALLDAGYNKDILGDQTLVGNVECAIEFIWQKRSL